MNTKEILATATVALGTATLTVAVFFNNPLNADDTPGQPAKPKLVVNNVELTLTAAGGRKFTAGDKPVFELCAVNTLDRPATARFKIAMSDFSARSALSRSPSAPAMLWEQPETLVLAPHETKRVELPTLTTLPASAAITVMLLNEEALVKPVATGKDVAIVTPPMVTAMNFSTSALALR
jgi:hypothetical protein